MKTSLWVVATVALLGSGVSVAQSDVLKTKGCVNCHAPDTKKVGPSIKDISAKYKGNAGAEADLVAKLKSGKGHMKASGTDAEIKEAVSAMLK